MKTLLEIQDDLRRNMTEGYSMTIDGFSPKRGGVLNIEYHGECLLSEDVETLTDAYDRATLFFASAIDNVPMPSIKKKVLSPKDFLTAFCCVCGIPREKLVEKNRKTEVRQPRQVITNIMWLNFAMQYSLKEIGQLVGVTHATVIHSVEAVSNMRETDARYRDYYDSIATALSDVLGKSIKC